MDVGYFSNYFCLCPSVSYSFQCTHFLTSLVKLIPKYFILFAAIVNRLDLLFGSNALGIKKGNQFVHVDLLYCCISTEFICWLYFPFCSTVRKHWWQAKF